MKTSDPNIEMLQLAAQGLEPLLDQVVFLGGCAAGLLVTDRAAAPPRETKDVDVIVEISSHHEYHLFSSQLRERGFCEDHREGAPMCRWLYHGVTVDVMPTEPAVLGFSNRWYHEAMASANPLKLPSGYVIRMVSAPLFLATKLEAFYGRGCGDFMCSHDLEDLISVIDGRPSIVDEVKHTASVRSYLADAFDQLLCSDDFLDSLPCHLPPDMASQQRVDIVLQRMGGIRDER